MTSPFTTNDTTGYAELLAWIVDHAPGPRLAVSIEGTRSYGVGLARAATAAGLIVLECEQPHRKARRGKGKSDPIDAHLAALRCDADRLPTPRADGDREALRILLTARQELTTASTAQINRLRALLLTRGPGPRAGAGPEHRPRSDVQQLRGVGLWPDRGRCIPRVTRVRRPSPRRTAHQRRRTRLPGPCRPAALHPRAAKRLVNLYRILRISVPDTMLDDFVETPGDGGPYQAAALLLASIVGSAEDGRQLLLALRGARPGEEIIEFLRSNGQHPLAELIESIARHAPVHHDAGTFRTWARTVARFSFATYDLFFDSEDVGSRHGADAPRPSRPLQADADGPYCPIPSPPRPSGET